MQEYFLNTGETFSANEYRNIGQVLNGIGSINNNRPFENDVSLNGVTLLEVSPSIVNVGQVQIITNSGEFFLSGNLLRDTTGFLNLGFQKQRLRNDFIEKYDPRLYRSENHVDLVTGFKAANGVIHGRSVFLNGVKLISGSNYEDDGSGFFEWIDPSEPTGVLFSIPAKNETYISGSFDVAGTMFNRGSSIGYYNGVKIDELDILESSSLILGLVNTGLAASKEFDIIPETESFIL